MQISKFYTYYLKRLFKNIWFWLGAIILNVASFWQRFEFNKAVNLYGGRTFLGQKIDPRALIPGNWKFFWFSILFSLFFYLWFWLIFGMPSTIGNLVGTSAGEPKENGEDAFFLSYTSPAKRNDLVQAKFLAGFTFFMVANLLYSLSAVFWWIKWSKSYLDYLFIFFQIFIAPILFFCLLAVPLFYLASKFSAKAVRNSVNYVIPILSLPLGGLFSFLIIRTLSKAENEWSTKPIWDAIKFFDYSALIILAFALFCLLIGFYFFYLYQKKFQEKDIT